MESTFWAPSLALFRGVEHRKNGFWGAARTQGVVGSGARTRFGGVLQTCVSAPRREKKVPDFVQKPPGYTRFCQFPPSILYVYYDTTTTILRSVAACSGYTRNRDSALYCCVRVHVRLCTYILSGTYNTLLYLVHTLERQTATTAAVVLQLLALSAAACLTLYTAV